MSLANWLAAAESRHAHLPDGPERNRLVKRTFTEIRDEAELIALDLPALSEDERHACLTEALLDVQVRFGFPEEDASVEQELFDARVDDLYARLQYAAREQKAPQATRSKLIARRLSRRWSRR